MKEKKFSIFEILILILLVVIVSVISTLIIRLTKKDTLEEEPKEKTVGIITEELLRSNEAYPYMNGTYLKGNVVDNYIWYNGFIWRIMGKNEDGSIRLITEETVTAIPWGNENNLEGYSYSYVKDWINNQFIPNLKDQSSLVESKFCEDKDFVSYNTKRTTCSNPVYAKGGLLSRDEYNLSDAEHSYLTNEIGSVTSSQFLISEKTTNVWLAYFSQLGEESMKTGESKGVRVIVSISPDTIVTRGEGTLKANQDSEYIVSSKSKVSTLKNAGLGEYVEFDGRTYRIMEQDGQKTKLILDGYYDTEVTYGENFNDLKKVLESNELISWLVPTRKEDLLLIAWHRGNSFEEGTSYRESLNSKANGYTGKVGIGRIGDVLSTQSLSLLTKNYSSKITRMNTKSYWLLNSKTGKYAWYMGEHDYASYDEFTSSHTIRPIIVVSSSLKVNSGQGLLSNPYKI